MEINLSYILTTFNKLSYLKFTLPDLIRACKEDEEIIIIDGGSTDGAKEYLESLFQQGKIHQLVSESDYGEANGYNKGMMMARGKLIKIISDDDVYYYPAISRCKQHMLQHSHVHVVGSDGMSINASLARKEFKKQYAVKEFRNWKEYKTPFMFCGLSLMLRKDALPLLGLWDCNFIIIDFEYTLRITSGKANIGWYEGFGFLNIVNRKSNSGKHWKRLEIERERLEHFYLNKKRLISYMTMDRIKNVFRPVKYIFFPPNYSLESAFEEIYQLSKEELFSVNDELPEPRFLS